MFEGECPQNDGDSPIPLGVEDSTPPGHGLKYKEKTACNTKQKLHSSPMKNPDVEPLCRSQRPHCSPTKLRRHSAIDPNENQEFKLTHTTLGSFATALSSKPGLPSVNEDSEKQLL